MRHDPGVRISRGDSLMKKLLTVIVVTAVCGALIRVGMLSYARAIRAGKPARFAVVTRGELDSQILLTGKVEPLKKVVVKSRVPGRVARVLVSEGDAVRAGQPLAQIESSELERQASQLRTALGAAQAQIPELAQQQASRRATMVEDLEQAESQLRLAQRALEAMPTTLAPANGNGADDSARLEQSIIHLRETLNKVRTELTSAKASAAQQQMQFQLLAGARGHMQRLIESAAAAKSALQQMTIKAPIAGRVIKCNVLPGDLVTGGANLLGGGQEIAVIADTKQMLVRALIPEVDVAKITEGQAATVRLDALRDEKFGGRITRIAPAAQEQRGPLAAINPNEPVWFQVEVRLAQTDPRLRTGMTANVDVATQKLRRTLYLPREAVFEEKGLFYVWLVSDRQLTSSARAASGAAVKDASGRVIEQSAVATKKALVHVGITNDMSTQIRAGVHEGDVVLVKPVLQGRRTFEIR